MARGTTGRHIRIADPLWRAVQDKARERGETVSDVTRRALLEYLAEDQHEQDQVTTV